MLSFINLHDHIQLILSDYRKDARMSTTEMWAAQKEDQLHTPQITKSDKEEIPAII